MTVGEYFGDWLKVIDMPSLNKVVATLGPLYQRKPIVPAFTDIFKAFTLCSQHDCKVIFLLQDPYPQRGVATGIALGNKAGTKELSPSLEVIKEACINYEIPHPPIKFDETLESWGRQGVLLLNSALTCEMGIVGSHVMLWRPFISKLIENLSHKEPGLIYVLFGSQAQTFEPYIDKRFNSVIKVHHPAYYARTNTRMPNHIFRQINQLLIDNYGIPIKWYDEILT